MHQQTVPLQYAIVYLSNNQQAGWHCHIALSVLGWGCKAKIDHVAVCLLPLLLQP